MNTDTTIKKPKDLTKIDSNNISELVWWSYQLGITPEKLLSLIQKNGNATEEIKKHIHS